MAQQDADNLIQYDAQSRQLVCRGEWDLAHFAELQTALGKLKLPSSGEVTIDGSAIEKMDSAGVLLLKQLQNKLEKKGVKVRFQKFSPQYQKLLSLVEEKLNEEAALQKPKKLPWLKAVGKFTVEQGQEFWTYLNFVGDLTLETLRIAPNPINWRWPSLADVIYKNGYLALPIIGLLSFMIGIVIAYQMGLQLRNYGANVYIVDLLGLSVLREFGPLITAIMVAGRTGSAFTAQLGMMKLNQEIDALDTMGVTPAELLVLPRILGLLIALPLLTMWADLFGVMGGMVMANNMLHISWYDFLHRFPRVIPLRALIIGLGKAPVFALMIASIGCFEGMQVRGGAESVGRNTTRSVVLSIFFIIVADAIFSVIFSKLKL